MEKKLKQTKINLDHQVIEMKQLIWDLTKEKEEKIASVSHSWCQKTLATLKKQVKIQELQVVSVSKRKNF